jgi:hypothetical protein
MGSDTTIRKNELVCNSCGTVFDAKTGAGLSGGCNIYPEAPAALQDVDGELVINANGPQGFRVYFLLAKLLT